jgi:hypothetical protein
MQLRKDRDLAQAAWKGAQPVQGGGEPNWRKWRMAKPVRQRLAIMCWCLAANLIGSSLRLGLESAVTCEHGRSAIR